MRAGTTTTDRDIKERMVSFVKGGNDNPARDALERLKPQCQSCFGLCCAALYFSKQEGFPTDKQADTPCPNLNEDFHCRIHKSLSHLGYTGCVAYDCFGAGQKVSQITFSGESWRRDPSSSKLMFQIFLVMRQLHEMCWYLNEALLLPLTPYLYDEIREALDETGKITLLRSECLLQFDVGTHSEKIYDLLMRASGYARRELCKMRNIGFNKERGKTGVDEFGKDLRKKDLRCADLRGACLIAANLEGSDLFGTDFTGADFRDTNLRGADLSKSTFLTQLQVNAARGNSETKLPPFISHPKHWNNAE